MSEGGRIITIGRNTAVRSGDPGSSVYSMTKAAVAVMVKGIVVDLAPRGITVNNVQPSPTPTDMAAEHIDAVTPPLTAWIARRCVAPQSRLKTSR